MPIFEDFLWTKIRPRSIGVGPEESRAAHESGGPPPGCAPLSRGQPGDPPDVKSTQNSSIYTQTYRKKPRSEVPPPQASVATRSQSRPSSAPCRRGPSSPVAMEEYPGEAIIAMKAKDQRENLSPSRGEAMEEEAQGGEPLLLSLGGTGVPSGGESSPR